MANTKYMPYQFRDMFLGGFKQATLSIALPATAAASVGEVTGVALPGVQVGDIVMASLVTPQPGVTLTAQATAAGVLAFTVQNGTAASLTSGSKPVNVVILRPSVP